MVPLSAHPAPAVTVAVVSWNTRDLLDACLGALRGDHEAGRAAVVVVDNGSTDGSPALVRDAHPWVRLLERPDNPGFGTAANAALAGAPSPFVAVANADTAVAPSALRALLDAAREHPRAGVLAPQLRTPDGPTQHSVHPFPSLAQVAAVDLGLARVAPGLRRRLALEGAWDPAAGRDVDWAHGAFLLLPTGVWRTVGGFDETLWMYAEDLDLCWRVHRAGHTTRYVPEAVVTHHVAAATAQAWGEERQARSQQAAYRWMRGHLGRPRTLAIGGLATAGGLGRTAVLGAATRLAPARYGWRRDRARGSAAGHRAGLREARRR